MNDIDKYIKSVALKLRDFDYIETVLLEKENFLNYSGNKIFPSDPVTMSHGLPGLCLLYAELDRQYPEEGWMEYCDIYIQKLVEIVKQTKIEDSSLFSGLCGICLAIGESSNNGKFYRKFKSSVDEFLKKLVQDKLNVINSEKNTIIFEYDTMQGLAGILNYMLLDNLNKKYFREEIEVILKYFIRLSSKSNYKGNDIPHWRIDSKDLFLEEEKKLFPEGAINLGVSHGISGPLIVMSKALESDINVDGLRGSILSITELLITKMDVTYKNWPSMVDIRDIANNERIYENSRDAWCYGRPGVAFALLKASQALNDKEILGIACESMLSGIHTEMGLISPTFCHGYIGVSYIYKKFFELTSIKEFDYEYRRLLEETLFFYDENLPFCYPNLENNLNEENYQIKKIINSMGILDGVVGILLPLLSMLGDKKTNWDAVFLLN
ncbi:lanthionine synthetase C family protein [Vagococcus fessus]|nr:lanthionine synthetase C family protein [Vagococcus fessus]